ncbi:FKBP-type peptidyl-prolyl cis-trans isomerase [Candidatus Saccharibacteria bacterium]|nr:FKBP-type peptidyl-prolyl cis-trans isomerase [Candidatus Saccharibacteria bacterium]
MIKNEANKTKPLVRLIVISAAILLLLSTFAMYMGMIMGANDDGNITQEQYQKMYDEYTNLAKKQQEKTEEISKKHFSTLSKYRSEVKAFNAADVKTIETKDLKEGDGDEVKPGNYAALYIGWLKDEKIFDSSFDDAQKPTKIASVLSEKQTTDLIEGWKSGVEGMKIGGVREITIPSELGYGDTEMGDIPKNSVLKFVIVALDPIGDDWSDRMSELSSKMQSYLLQQQLQQQTEKSDDTSAKQDESKSNSK